MAKLGEDLWKVAEDTALAFGFSFASDCELHLRRFLQVGVSTIESQGLASEPEKLVLAKTNAMLFVTSMVAEARRMGLQELHEPTFFAVKDRLCPLWPFC